MAWVPTFPVSSLDENLPEETLSNQSAFEAYLSKGGSAASTPVAGLGWPRITGITDLGKMSGTYFDSQATERRWTYIDAKTGFQKLTSPKKILIVGDINAWKRTVGHYFDGTTDRAFTFRALHASAEGYCESKGLNRAARPG